jgi:hypothetical protein
MVPDSSLPSVVIRITKMDNMAMNANGVVDVLRAIHGEKRTNHVSLEIQNRA